MNKKYLDWAKAGGPDECEHGYAKGIPCPQCDREKEGSTMPHKLSEAQRRVLEAMRDGAGTNNVGVLIQFDYTNYNLVCQLAEQNGLSVQQYLVTLVNYDLRLRSAGLVLDLRQAGRAALQQSGVGEGV